MEKNPFALRIDMASMLQAKIIKNNYPFQNSRAIEAIEVSFIRLNVAM